MPADDPLLRLRAAPLKAPLVCGRLAVGSVAAMAVLLCVALSIVFMSGTAHASQSTTVESISTTTTIPRVSHSGAAPWLGEVDWLPRPLGRAPWGYGLGVAVVLVVLWQAIRSALSALIGTLMANVRLLGPWKPRPLLQPSPYATRAEIEQTGRIPIEPTVNGRGRIGLIRRVVLSRIVPITAKPAFLLSTWDKDDGSNLPRDPGGFTAGGYRLLLRVAGTENPMQLLWAIGAVRLRVTRVVLICTLENYLNRTGKVHRCTIDWRRVKREPDQPDTVVVYAADKLRCGGSNYEVVPRSEIREKGVWLVTPDQRSGPSPHQGTAEVPGRSSQGRQRFRDRCRRGRRWWWPPAALGVLGLFSMALPPSQDYLLSAMTYPQLEIYALASLILGWFGSIALWTRLMMYLRYERPAPPSWTATTTRCLVDGAHVRNGMFKQLPRRDRYRMLVNSHDPAQPDPCTVAYGTAEGQRPA